MLLLDVQVRISDGALVHVLPVGGNAVFLKDDYKPPYRVERRGPVTEEEALRLRDSALSCGGDGFNPPPEEDAAVYRDRLAAANGVIDSLRRQLAAVKVVED